ncbi:MAG: hypothetical protein NDJ92_07000, partial [Thermoanaerobaculia bacterium]|nr:hypothetical protein [Thermoanaerobaculia bacterium]
MFDRFEGVLRGLRVAALVAVLLVAPATLAADSDPDPSWFDIVQTWFASLLDDDPPPTDPEGGV